MNHYCTYFDRGFLIQGVALWRSLAAHETTFVLWVLALDDFTAEILREFDDGSLRIVSVTELERSDVDLAAAKSNRTRVEFYFTLSPCWPRWILGRHPEVSQVTYVDADMFFFGSSAAIFEQMDAAGASILVTEHRFLPWQRHYEQHGKFNVGILSFRNDEAGRGCLDDWRARCLAWCYDRMEDGKYADQKYLDDWPGRFGNALLVLNHAGVNLAPWNWRRHRIAISESRGRSKCRNELDTHSRTKEVRVDGRPLIIFHFARFRPWLGTWAWQSGQLEYGVMPHSLRRAIYAPYVRALLAARSAIAARHSGFDFPKRSARLGRAFWRALPLRIVFGGDWLRIHDRFFNLRFGVGRWSGQALAKLRTAFLRR